MEFNLFLLMECDLHSFNLLSSKADVFISKASTPRSLQRSIQGLKSSEPSVVHQRLKLRLCVHICLHVSACEYACMHMCVAAVLTWHVVLPGRLPYSSLCVTVRTFCCTFSFHVSWSLHLSTDLISRSHSNRKPKREMSLVQQREATPWLLRITYF